VARAKALTTALLSKKKKPRVPTPVPGDVVSDVCARMQAGECARVHA
jgi:hypothetical protein